MLNEAFQRDPAAIHALVVNRVPCNDALANAPHIPVDRVSVPGTDIFEVGFLGMLNAVLKLNDLPMIAGTWTTAPDSSGRCTFKGFTTYNP